MPHHLDELMRLHDEAICAWMATQHRGLAQDAKDADAALRTAIAKALDEARGAWQPTIVEDPSKLANCKGIPPPCVAYAGNVEAWKEHVRECVRQICELDLGTLRLEGCRVDIEMFVDAVVAAPTQPATAGKEQAKP